MNAHINNTNSLILAVMACGIFTSSISAMEIENLHSRQDDNRVVLEYDLIGKSDELNVGVEVFIEFDNKRYSPKDLHVSGDFGQAVNKGSKLKIYWDVLQDRPTGFKGEVIWDIVTFGERDALAKSEAEHSARKQEELIRSEKENNIEKEVEDKKPNEKNFIPIPSL